MDVHLLCCEHCGYEHSEEEIAELKNALRKGQRPWIIAGTIFFPLLIFVLYEYFTGKYT